MRLGDPLSPYLFTIIMELLSCLLLEGWARKLYLPHPRCKRIELSHISFVDDIIVFYRGEGTSVKAIIEIINTLARYTGLVVNKEKTILIVGGIEVNTAQLWANGLGINTSSLPLKFLGLPLSQAGSTPWTAFHLSRE